MALNHEALKTAIYDPALKNMCTLQSKLATKNKSEDGRAVKPPNFLDWRNMAISTNMAKTVNKGKKSPGEEDVFL